MPRRPALNWTSLAPTLGHAELLRELNRRLGQWKRAQEDFADPYDLPYSATVTINALASVYFTLVVTNGTAFTLANPLNPGPGQDLWLDIKNSSGGAMGAITWGTEFLRDASWANPANTKRRVIGFTRVASLWVQRAPATGDM